MQDSIYPVQLTLMGFLSRFGLKCVDVPPDGHCFISCIRLFFHEYLPSVADQTVAMLRDKCDQLFTSGVFEQMGYNAEEFAQNSKTYFKKLRFDNDFVDNFIGLRNDLFNIRILILSEQANGHLLFNADMSYNDHRLYYPDNIGCKIKNTLLPQNDKFDSISIRSEIELVNKYIFRRNDDYDTLK